MSNANGIASAPAPEQWVRPANGSSTHPVPGTGGGYQPPVDQSPVDKANALLRQAQAQAAPQQDAFSVHVNSPMQRLADVTRQAAEELSREKVAKSDAINALTASQKEVRELRQQLAKAEALRTAGSAAVRLQRAADELRRRFDAAHASDALDDMADLASEIDAITASINRLTSKLPEAKAKAK